MGDPREMMKGVMTNPESFNSLVKMAKSNPDMIKPILVSQAGGDKVKEKQIEKAIDSFVQMDDATLEKYLKRVNMFQGLMKPFVTAFEKLRSTLGLSTKTLIFMLNLMFVGMLFLLGKWWKNKSGADDMALESMLEQDEPPEIVSNY